jgi:hypothetical protein
MAEGHEGDESTETDIVEENLPVGFVEIDIVTACLTAQPDLDSSPHLLTLLYFEDALQGYLDQSPFSVLPNLYSQKGQSTTMVLGTPADPVQRPRCDVDFDYSAFLDSTTLEPYLEASNIYDWSSQAEAWHSSQKTTQFGKLDVNQSFTPL